MCCWKFSVYTIMDSSPSFRRRSRDDISDFPENVVECDQDIPPASFLTPSHGIGTSDAGCSTGSMAGENRTERHPAMHVSTITPPRPVEPQEMMTPDPNARYIHGEQVREDCIPKKNMVFATDDEGYEFYRRYAREAGFGSKKHRKKAMSRVYACSRQGSSTFYKEGEERKRAKMSKRVACEAQVKIKLKGKEWFYEKVELEHNHALNPDPCEVKHMRSHKNKDPVIMEYVDDLQHSGVSPNATMNVLPRFHGGTGLLLMNERDLENRRAANLRKDQVDDVKKLKAFFNEYRRHNPNFFYDIDYDSNGVVKNIFWSHASCQANFAEFGDVVTFDTTYRSNFYHMPLGMFVGSNHHLQNVIFGFVLVGDETEDTFEWAFRTFRTCMEGSDPICILTDQDQAMANALRRVFLKTIHRLCRFHILNKHSEILNKLSRDYEGFEKKFNATVNHPLTPPEFENAWQELLREYGLESDPTLCSLYEERASWIAAYFKNVFCGRMTSTQRSESMNRMVKRNHVDESTPLHVFAERMYQVLQKGKNAEARENIAQQDIPATRTNYPLERQLSRIYTRAVFKKYQEAYVAGTSFLTKKVDTRNFLVYYGKDGPDFSWSQHEFKVVCDQVKEEYSCECKRWEHTGLLCSHLIIVLVHEQIQKIPSRYVLRRYSRNAHIDLPYDRNDTLQTGPSGISKSGINCNLLRESYAVVRAGNRSTVAYERAMTVLKELRLQLEEIPADEMPVHDEPAKDDQDGNLAIILKAPTKSSTKGSRSQDGAAPIIGARGKKMCNRVCSNCGLKAGHNRASCLNPPQTFAVGGTSAGKGRGRGRRGRGRGRGWNSRGKRAMGTRRRLLDDVEDEDEDDQGKDDEVDSEPSCGSDSSD